MISIKEVTKQTEITVRTMRYYDHIGLLSPAGKTEGGHRLYGEQELKTFIAQASNIYWYGKTDHRTEND